MQAAWLASRDQPEFTRALILQMAGDIPGSVDVELAERFGLVAAAAAPAPRATAGFGARSVRNHLIRVLAAAGATRSDITSLTPQDVRTVGATWRAGPATLRTSPRPDRCACCALAWWLHVLEQFDPAGARSQFAAAEAAAGLDHARHACQYAAALNVWRATPRLILPIDAAGNLEVRAISTRSITAALATAAPAAPRLAPAPRRAVRPAAALDAERIAQLPDLLDALEEQVGRALEASRVALEKTGPWPARSHP